MMIVSSSTRFVDASSNAIAAVKSAPLRKIERAMATAAYEHELDAAPRLHALRRVSGRASPSTRAICCFETTA